MILSSQRTPGPPCAPGNHQLQTCAALSEPNLLCPGLSESAWQDCSFQPLCGSPGQVCGPQRLPSLGAAFRCAAWRPGSPGGKAKSEYRGEPLSEPNKEDETAAGYSDHSDLPEATPFKFLPNVILSLLFCVHDLLPSLCLDTGSHIAHGKKHEGAHAPAGSACRADALPLHFSEVEFDWLEGWSPVRILDSAIDSLWQMADSPTSKLSWLSMVI